LYIKHREWREEEEKNAYKNYSLKKTLIFLKIYINNDDDLRNKKRPKQTPYY